MERLVTREDAPDFVEFARDLVSHGFTISTDRFQAAQRILSGLAAEGVLSNDPQRACRRLGVVLCQTPGQQHDFPDLFNDWWKREWWTLVTALDNVAPPLILRAADGTNALTKKNYVLIGMVILLIVLFGAYAFSSSDLLTGVPVRPGPANGTSSRPYFGMIDLLLRNAWWIATLLVFIPIALFLKGRHFRRGVADGIQAVIDIRVRATKLRTFQSGESRQRTSDMRRTRAIEVDEIDVVRSIEAIASTGGEPRAALRMNRGHRPVLGLTHTTGEFDHFAQIVHDLFERMRDAGSDVDERMFEHSLRRIRTRGVNSPRNSLTDLRYSHADSLLVVAADPTCFDTMSTGMVAEWANTAATWTERILVVPSLSLSDAIDLQFFADWEITDLSLRGLEKLQGWLSGRRVSHYRPMRSSSPPLWVSDPESAVTQIPPGEFYEARIVEELQHSLTPVEFELLCAAAAFPEVRWRYTVELTQQLSGPIHDVAIPLARVSELPWMRTGSMPDWLRIGLAHVASNRARRASRIVFQRLFHTFVSEPNADHASAIPVVAPRLNWFSLFRLRMRLGGMNHVDRITIGMVGPRLTRISIPAARDVLRMLERIRLNRERRIRRSDMLLAGFAGFWGLVLVGIVLTFGLLGFALSGIDTAISAATLAAILFSQLLWPLRLKQRQGPDSENRFQQPN